MSTTGHIVLLDDAVMETNVTKNNRLLSPNFPTRIVLAAKIFSSPIFMGFMGVLLMVAAPARAAFPIPQPTVLVPPPPNNIVTPSGTNAATIGTPQSVTVRWFVSSLLRVNYNAPPSHFVICARPATTACTWPMGTQAGVFTSPATGGAVTRTPEYLGNPFGPRIIIGYNYAMNVSITDSLFDQSLQFAVAACAAPSMAACVAANGGRALYTTKDLAAQASIFMNQGRLLFTGQASNIGSSSATFATRIRAGGAAISPTNRCETDPLAVRNPLLSFHAVLRDGSIIDAEDAFGLDVVALTVDAPMLPSLERTATGSLSGGGNIGNPIAMVSLDLPVSDFEAGSDPFAVFIITTVDATSQVVELNEGNNKWVECRVFFP